MILRKPYAFLIKHFKLLHMIVSVFMAYCLYKSFTILSFFGDYITSGLGIIGQNIGGSIYDALLFLSPFIIIIFSLILLVVMAVKKKPYVMYIVNIAIYVFTLVLFFIGKSTVLELEINLVDIRVVKIVRDLMTLSLLLQIYPLIKNITRAVGFDIKQFDFAHDLAQIEIEEKDNEEFEVNVSVDTNKVKRNVNSKKRNLKYIYAENKFLINISIAGIILIIGAITIYGVFKYNTKTSINQTFTMDGFSIKVLRSYVTRNDYKGNIITSLNENMSLVVVPINVKNNNTAKKELITAKIMLQIGEHKFRHNSIYRDAIFDLGSIYENKEIDAKDTINTNLVFIVPASYLDQKMHIKFITSLDLKGKDLIPYYVDIKLNPLNLDINKEVLSINANEEKELTNSILGNSVITINNAEVSKRFRSDYKFCVATNECVDSYEYVLADLNTNIDKSLLKLSGNIIYDNDYKVSSLNQLYDLIKYFGTIEYKIENQIKKVSSGLTKVETKVDKKDNTIYVSIPEEVENAEWINLVFNIRNKQYIFKVK